MTVFIRKTLSVVFALIAALAWIWTTFLKDQGLITETQRKWVLIFLTFLLAIQQIYLVLPKPGNKKSVEARREVVEYYLQEFLYQYYQSLQRFYTTDHPDLFPNKSPEYPAVRVNLMLPTMRVRGLFGSYLKIYYSACPEKVTYSNEERTLKWKKGQGSCGNAWKEGQISVYDSNIPDLSLPEDSLPQKHKLIVGKIRSTLSVPLYYNDGIAGILNLDSRHSIEETRFIDVYQLARKCATAIEGLFPESGIAD
mgnify:CR=1 FL=1